MMLSLIFSKHSAAVTIAAVTDSLPNFPDDIPRPWEDNDGDLEDE